ncbi:MAG: T9SS type A sorting domain-containing protein [Bacteroidota bacterium]
MVLKRIGTIGFALVALTVLSGWGSVGHKFINRNMTLHLPPEMLGFIQRIQFLGDNASVADNRKSSDPTEGPKHFMDIDDYPEFAAHSVFHNLDSLVQKYGATRVYDNGISPFATLWAVDSLTAQMKRGDWTKAWSTAADLGHYVGDQHQPLHNAKNYDGQYTGNSGIHSRYESSMISTYQGQLVVTPSSVKYIDKPIEFIFDCVYTSNAFVDSVLAADNYAKQVSGWSGSGSAPASYYTALWGRCKSFTLLQMQQATEHFASLLYTAWVNAGSPPIPGVAAAGIISATPGTIVLGQNYPNPFNLETAISYQLSATSFVRLGILDMQGRKVATIVNEEQPAGTYTRRWNAGGMPSGVYFCMLQAGGFTVTRKLVLIK